MTVHIESKKEDIAPRVLMPGDPNRAHYIASKYLKDAKLVNRVRGELAYTGTYKDVPVTIFSSGMGIGSMGIYSYELFNDYDVEKIIRIGTAGSYKEDLKVFTSFGSFKYLFAIYFARFGSPGINTLLAICPFSASICTVIIHRPFLLV